MGKVKARDIVDGWPRSRSTVGLWNESRAREYALCGDIVLLFPNRMDLLNNLDFNLDVTAERIEEKRKLNMMRAFLMPPPSLLRLRICDVRADSRQEDVCRKLRLRVFA